MKKKLINRILAMLLILVFLIGMFLPINVQATVTTDDVTTNEILTNSTTSPDDDTENVVHISDAMEFSQIRIPGSGNNFVLDNDIEIPLNWEPIDNFTGTLDGNGHTITYDIDESTGAIPTIQFLGLFGTCDGATIKNLNVTGNILLTTGGSLFNPNVYAGGVIANAKNTTLENVHFSGNININTSNDNSSWVGGLVGKAENTQIVLSSNKASITAKGDSIIGTSRAGGLCGELDGTIESCYNFGDIMATAISESPYAGGLVGYNKGTIAESYNAGKVKSEGSGLSLSDVYAGGIAAFGENGSSITNCAVMSPEINVTIGYINNGYKYIIANGGSKSNNISINNIVGAPTNDSNSQYTQDEMKTTSPYSGFDFYNKWMISENFNNGYPFHYINNYVNIAIQDIIVPQKLNFFINNNFISINDLKQTSDGFTLCTKPLSEIFSDMGIDEIRTDQYNEEGELQTFELADLDDWYIFSVANTCSILKMRNGIGKTKGGEDPGTAIPFIELDLDLIKLFYEDLQQQTEESENELQYFEHELQLSDAIDKVTRGVVDSDCSYSEPIADYFAVLYSEANHLIAEEYIKKIISLDMDSNGYIIVPSEISTDQEEFLLTLPDIYDEENERIKVDAGNLTLDEKHAILVCRTGNQSLNNYAAENFLHARYTVIIGDFLQGTDEILELDDEIMDRAAALVKFDASIKADAGVGEESFSKEMIIIKGYENMLDIKYGNV